MGHQALQRLGVLIGRVCDGLVRIGAVVLAFMMVLTFFDVVGRYAFNSPIVGTVEMTELCMGLIVFLGIGITTHAHGHITVDLVTARLTATWRQRLEILTRLASLVLASLMCWQLWVVAADTVSNNLLTPVWELPVYPVAYVMAAASLLVVVPLIVQTMRSVATLGAGRGV